MPVGLSNALATLLGLMNDTFDKNLRDYDIVFFDDILMFRKSVENHLPHLHFVLLILRDNALVVKLSKFSFPKVSLQYLGHIVASDGIRVDMEKIDFMI